MPIHRDDGTAVSRSRQSANIVDLTDSTEAESELHPYNSLYRGETERRSRPSRGKILSNIYILQNIYSKKV